MYLTALNQTRFYHGRKHYKPVGAVGAGFISFAKIGFLKQRPMREQTTTFVTGGTRVKNMGLVHFLMEWSINSCFCIKSYLKGTQ